MRRSVLKLIAESSPQRPACFDTHEQWVQWLTSAHVGGQRVVRRVDLGKHRKQRFTYHEVLPVGQQSHCADCSLRRQEQMRAEQRCFPVRARHEPDDEEQRLVEAKPTMNTNIQPQKPQPFQLDLFGSPLLEVAC